MKALRTLTKTAAALVVALLLFVSGAHAQTITNTAQADWMQRGLSHSAASNTVEITVTSASIVLDTFRPVPGSALTLPIRASLCGNTPVAIFPGSASSNADIALAQSTELRIGEVLVFRVAAPLANRDPGVVEQVTATLTTLDGAREVLTIFETEANTGIFTGAIRTRDVSTAAVHSDCQLGVVPGDTITVAISRNDGSAPLVSALVALLADPFGFVFDSDDGTPITGARVSLVDANTGAPARVFADDGITSWPSSVISGQPVTDAAGNVYPMQPGEYRFPSTLSELIGSRVNRLLHIRRLPRSRRNDLLVWLGPADNRSNYLVRHMGLRSR